MKTEIIGLAKKEKISDIGFCSAERYLEKAAISPAGACFCSSKNMESLMDGAKTVIVCAFSYYSGAEKGNISRYAQGLDYHTVARNKMSAIVDFLVKQGYSGMAFADNGPLNERLLATLSGLAFIGKNHMAINERLGSYFFIGYIITDCWLEPDEENRSKCANCGECIRVCPMGALCEESFKEEKCLSYVTQKKGELKKEERDAIIKANSVWGCDMCQEVCPHNRGIEITEIDEFKNDLIVNLKIDDDLSNKDFKRLYNDRAFAWRGKSVLIRNQNVIYNRKKNEK